MGEHTQRGVEYLENDGRALKKSGGWFLLAAMVAVIGVLLATFVWTAGGIVIAFVGFCLFSFAITRFGKAGGDEDNVWRGINAGT